MKLICQYQLCQEAPDEGNQSFVQHDLEFKITSAVLLHVLDAVFLLHMLDT